MRKQKIYLSILLSILIIMFNMCSPLTVFASGGGSFADDAFTYTYTWTNSAGATFNAYGMVDESSIPNGYYYYYKIADGKCVALEASEVITNILNNKVGIIGSINMIADFILQYTSDHFGWSLYDTPVSGRNVFPDATRVVIKGNSCVGVAMNDIAGCKIVNASDSNPSVTVPNDVVNSVYNYYQEVYIIENPQTPDYIIVPCATKASAIESGLDNQTTIDYFDNTSYNYNFTYSYLSERWTDSNSINRCYVNRTDIEPYFVGTGNFDRICNNYGLSQDKTEITLSEAIASVNADSLTVTAYDKATSEIATNWLMQAYVPSGGSYNFSNSFYCLSNKQLAYIKNKSSFTVYKTANIVQQINNNVYSPNNYKTNNYKNYSTSNNNSYNTTVQNINNSSSNNTSIYNESKTTNNTTIKNEDYDINNTTITNNTTNITYNYYGDNGSGGGSGGDDDDDDDDDTIWKALLKAIGDFLKKIGELIATILTGLISILTSVLDAIASITENFTGVTSFLSSVFGFLPSDVLAVITLGITLGILISLIKMFGK